MALKHRTWGGLRRNFGIEKAKAPLLFFLDADDYLVPTALEEMVRAYTKKRLTSLAIGGRPIPAKNWNT
jgi:glycosyltransferase involved in cell wall biosynthesis